MITLKMIRDRLGRKNTYTTVDFWDDVAVNSYDKKGTLPHVNPHLNEIYHSVEGGILYKWLPDVNGKLILDIGCGVGRYCRELADKNAIVHGVDFSPSSIDVAKNLTRQTNVTYSVGSIYQIEAISQYGILICSRVLAVACRDESEVQTCIDLIWRALKPGGRVIFIEPLHQLSFMARVLRMDLPTFEKCIETAGFKIVAVEQCEFYFGRLALAYFRLPRWLTQAIFAGGETISSALPVLADQKFVLAERVAL